MQCSDESYQSVHPSSRLYEKLQFGIFLNGMNKISVSLCVTVLVELYPLPLRVMVVSNSWRLKLYFMVCAYSIILNYMWFLDMWTRSHILCSFWVWWLSRGGIWHVSLFDKSINLDFSGTLFKRSLSSCTWVHLFLLGLKTVTLFQGHSCVGVVMQVVFSWSVLAWTSLNLYGCDLH